MPKQKGKYVNYAVIGMGHIAQAAVLPAFEHAKKNSRLAALITGDPDKSAKLTKKYGTKAYDYEEYDACLRSGEIDAVFIALPNHLHCQYAVKAARAGVHVLCEKPMAVTEQECRRMIAAAEERDVRLMIAYRLHFEESNMEAVKLIKNGKIGEPRIFNSVFTMQVKPDNIRIDAEKGGGTLYDIGIYCINAARYLFQEEPLEVYAMSSQRKGKRFEEVDEMTSAILRFPGDRLAVFTSSFGAAPSGSFQVVGTKGEIKLEQAYEYIGDRLLQVTVNESKKERKFPTSDQFAPELIYFSDCILKETNPEPSGYEGLADIRIIEALYRSAQKGRSIMLQPIARGRRPDITNVIRRPPVKKPSIVHAKSASE